MLSASSRHCPQWRARQSAVLRNVGQEWVEQHKEEAKLGRMLLVGNDYLAQAFDYFELVGLLLCVKNVGNASLARSKMNEAQLSAVTNTSV